MISVFQHNRLLLTEPFVKCNCNQVQCGDGQVGYGRKRRSIPYSMPSDPNKIFEAELSAYIKVGYDSHRQSAASQGLSPPSMSLKVGDSEDLSDQDVAASSATRVNYVAASSSAQNSNLNQSSGKSGSMNLNRPLCSSVIISYLVLIGFGLLGMRRFD